MKIPLVILRRKQAGAFTKIELFCLVCKQTREKYLSEKRRKIFPFQNRIFFTN